MKSKKIVEQLASKTYIRFAVVGVLNTILGLSLMFGFYNIGGFGYWGSSALSYILASVFSFFMNKNFTFKSSTNNATGIIKFSLNIAICYLAAYMIAKLVVATVVKNLSFDITIKSVEQIALLFGMLLFVTLNYFGQKILVFKK